MVWHRRMSGNPRFELASAGPDSSFAGNYSQRGAYSGPVLDRSGSFREVSDARLSNSGKNTVWGTSASSGDIPSLSQCLMLEPVIMGDQRYTRSGELRRVLGYSVGSEDNSFGATHLRNPTPVAVEELKRFRASVADTCVKASGRSKKLDEHLHKLNKYCESMTPPKKQQRSDSMTNERSIGSNFKTGNQIHRIPSDPVSQKLDDRPKNVILNKRLRTSVAETRAEGRSNGLPRSSLITLKDREVGNADSDIPEEKIRRLPAGGESWDKKMKRKRSVGMVCSRPIDSDGEPKRTMNHKVSSEPGLPSSDLQIFRSGANNVATGVANPDNTSLVAGSSARGMLKIEQDKSIFPRELTTGLNKDRLLAKGNMKLSNWEDNHALCPSPITKGKASRAPRTGSSMNTNSISNVPRVSGALESWELPQNMIKNSSVTGANSRKRAMPSGSSSPPITQWVGQRPQKISRNRRANLVSPVSNHDEIQTPSEGCSPEFGSKLASNASNSSLLSKGSASGIQNAKLKTETVSSPARYSESEESGAGENRLKEKGVGSSEVEEKAVNAVLSVGSSTILGKKNKFFVKEDSGDGVGRQGRSGRGSSVSRTSISPVREKMDNAATTKLIRTMRPNCEKNGSRTGRPLKKLSERKGFSRLGHAISAGSPDFSGESDDDREDLLAAANFAYNSSVNACSNTFWKKVEALFAPISSEGKSYLSEQLKSAEELHESLSQSFGNSNNLQGGCAQEEISLSDTPSEERSRSTQNKCEPKDMTTAVESVDNFEGSNLSGALDSRRRFEHVAPLYQTLLSALIIEDDVEEFDENGWDRCVSNQNDLLDSPDDTCSLLDVEGKNMSRMEYECESVYGVQTHSNGSVNGLFSYHAHSNSGRKSILESSPWNGELMQRENGYVQSEVQLLVGLSSRDMDLVQGQGNSSIDCQYEQLTLEDKLLLELHSIGLYPEPVPDLHNKEDEVVNQEIIQLKSGLYQQVRKKKTRLDKIYEAIQGGKDVDGQDLEQDAMNKLVEMAYKKLLATRGSLASKNGIAKVSKQVALAFARRTVARCKKFEDSGVSCFNEPGLREIIFAPPPPVNEAEPLNDTGLATGNYSIRNVDRSNPFETFSHQSDQAFAKNGPILNRGKKKEVLLDDVGGAAIRTTSLASTLLGGAKGKRSERDGNREASMRHGIAKSGRSPLGNSKGERKTKSKPKQKTAQLSTSGSGFVKFMESSNPTYPISSGSSDLFINGGNRKREVGIISPGNGLPNSSKEVKELVDFPNFPLNDIDSIDELGAASDLDGSQDFNSWFNNVDVDGLPEHDSVGLEIPMDDLSELIMF